MGRGGGGEARDLIVLTPCGADEVLPVNVDLPADLFTSCLTTPMPIALRWFVRQNRVCFVCVDVSGIVCVSVCVRV